MRTRACTLNESASALPPSPGIVRVFERKGNPLRIIHAASVHIATNTNKHRYRKNKQLYVSIKVTEKSQNKKSNNENFDKRALPDVCAYVRKETIKIPYAIKAKNSLGFGNRDCAINKTLGKQRKNVIIII